MGAKKVKKENDIEKIEDKVLEIEDKVDDIAEDIDNKVEKIVEEKLNDKATGSRASKVIIFILSIALILSLGYIAYDKGFIFNDGNKTDNSLKENGKEEETEEKDFITRLEVNDSLVVSLFNKLNMAVDHYCGVDEYYTNSKVSVFGLGNEFVFDVAVFSVENMYGKVDITEEQFNNVVSSIFGSGYKYQHVQYSNKCAPYLYSSNIKAYKYQDSTACGGSCGPYNIKQILGAYKYDDKLVIEVGVLFADVEYVNNETVGFNYYKDYNRTVVVNDYDKDSVSGFAIDNVLNAKKGTLYNMVFNLENDNYVYSYTEPASNN